MDKYEVTLRKRLERAERRWPKGTQFTDDAREAIQHSYMRISAAMPQDRSLTGNAAQQCTTAKGHPI